MRRWLPTGFLAVIASLSPPGTGAALERVAVPDRAHAEADLWRQGATCVTGYFNLCTGWLWVWSGWEHGDVVGTVHEPCCSSGATLVSTSTYVWTGAAAGYGFTGSIQISPADGAGCPSGPLAQQSFLPVTGANLQAWSLPVTGPIVVSVTLTSTQGTPQPSAFPSDHPAAGPTGPPAWGSCYPTTRAAHSYYYGNSLQGGLCPGSPLFDGVGTAEWLEWSALFECSTPTRETTWAHVKSLYR
ncbi:MAG TPA: hypothetical protein VKU85_09870 [bacterium]|nr:hypothetical protein [bacterium]